MKKNIYYYLLIFSLLLIGFSSYFLFYKKDESLDVSSGRVVGDIVEGSPEKNFFEKIISKILKESEVEEDVLLEDIITEIDQKAKLWASDAKLYYCYGIVAIDEGSVFTHEPGKYPGWMCTYFSLTKKNLQKFEYLKYDGVVVEASSSGQSYENILWEVEGTILEEGIRLEGILGSAAAYDIAVEAGMDVINNDYDMSLTVYKDYSALDEYYGELNSKYEELNVRMGEERRIFDEKWNELELLYEELDEKINGAMDESEYTPTELEELYEKVLRYEELYEEILKDADFPDDEFTAQEELDDGLWDSELYNEMVKDAIVWQIIEVSQMSMEDIKEINIYIIDAYTGELYRKMPSEMSY